MKDYCRYCGELNITFEKDATHFLCDEKMKYVSIYSHCDKYWYCGFNERMEEHKPREHKVKEYDGEQLGLESETE